MEPDDPEKVSGRHAKTNIKEILSNILGHIYFIITMATDELLYYYVTKIKGHMSQWFHD